MSEGQAKTAAGRLRSDLRTLAQILAQAAPEGPVAAVGVARIQQALGGAQILDAGDALPHELAALVVGSLPHSSQEELQATIERYRGALRAGGLLLLAVPTPGSGLRGAASALWARMRVGRPLPLEDLCGALLAAHLHDIRAQALGGPLGLSAIWARMPG